MGARAGRRLEAESRARSSLASHTIALQRFVRRLRTNCQRSSVPDAEFAHQDGWARVFSWISKPAWRTGSISWPWLVERCCLASVCGPSCNVPKRIRDHAHLEACVRPKQDWRQFSESVVEYTDRLLGEGNASVSADLAESRYLPSVEPVSSPAGAAARLICRRIASPLVYSFRDDSRVSRYRVTTNCWAYCGMSIGIL
jgi:hypothetical protein